MSDAVYCVVVALEEVLLVLNGMCTLYCNARER